FRKCIRARSPSHHSAAGRDGAHASPPLAKFLSQLGYRGKTPHVRYHRPDGSVRDEPSREEPVHSGRWSVQWMKPEPMHAIEVVENPGGVPNSFAGPPLLRIELKCHP